MVKGLNLKKTHRQCNLLWASLSPWEQDSAADLHHPNSLKKEYRLILGLFWVRGVLLLLQMHAGFHLFALLFGNGVGSLLPAYLCHHKGWKLLSSMFSFFFFFLKQKTSLSLTHSTEGNGALKKPPNMARLMVKALLLEDLLAPQGTGVFWFALAWCITENYSSPSSNTVPDVMEFITSTKRREEALYSPPRQGVEMKKHPGQFSRKATAIPPLPKSHLPNSRVRGRKDTSGTGFFLNHQSLPTSQRSFFTEKKKFPSSILPKGSWSYFAWGTKLCTGWEQPFC